jgi:ABC-type phosphate/phosphonate transport system substrate-binding protein
MTGHRDDERYRHQCRDREQERRFVEALLAMSYDNPVHRPILDAEGLRRWLAPDLDGYAELRLAAAEQGFFVQVLAKSA